MEQRTCKYCGCDISHLKANATICGSKECTAAYRRDSKQRKDEPRYCEVCGKSINDLPRQRRICLDPECEAEQKRRKYATSLKEKTCVKCGKTFLGTAKQTCCENCRKVRTTNYKTVEQKILCKYCNTVLETATVKLTSKTLLEKHGKKVCDICKSKNRKKVSEDMKLNNPMFNKETVNKVRKTRREIYLAKCNLENRVPYKPVSYKGETREMMIQRMKTNNPMFKPEIKQKVSETLKARILSGEIVYKKGKEHPLWKGNRNFNKAVRIELRNWVKECFEKVNYTCQKCGKTHTELQVHHLEPLRDIISKYLQKFNYTQEYINDIEGTEEYFDFIKEIVKYHYDNFDIGIVVCPECHSKLDTFYKRKTHENSSHKKDTI